MLKPKNEIQKLYQVLAVNSHSPATYRVEREKDKRYRRGDRREKEARGDRRGEGGGREKEREAGTPQKWRWLLPEVLKVWEVQSVSSVAQSCPTFCHPRDCCTPGLPVHHQLQELT